MSIYSRAKLAALAAMATIGMRSQDEYRDAFRVPDSNPYVHPDRTDSRCDELRKQKAEEKRRRKAERRLKSL